MTADATNGPPREAVANDARFEAVVAQEEALLRLIHPTAEDVPGCMTQLDGFLACNIMNSQMKSLYRFGRSAECAYKLEDFKWCIGNKNLSPDDKRDAWIRRRAEWWAHRRLGKSSEDVWEVRSEPLVGYPPAFSSDVSMSHTIA